MANAWTPKDVKLASLKPVTTDTTTTVSKNFPVTAGGAQVMRVGVKLASTNSTGTVQLHLRSAMAGSEPFLTQASTAALPTADGWFYINFRDSVQLLGDLAQIQVQSVGGAQFTVDKVLVLQED